MDALGSWSMPQRVPVSNFRNQQQSTTLRRPTEYAQDKQQSEAVPYTQDQSYHRNIYSAGRGIAEQQNSAPVYNHLRFDPKLQNHGVQGHTQHPLQQHSRALQMQSLTHHANHQQPLTSSDVQRQRRPSYQDQQAQLSLQHPRISTASPWDQNAATATTLDTRNVSTDKTGSRNGFSGRSLQLSPQSYQFSTNNLIDSQPNSATMKGPDSVSRRSSGQTLNPQVQVNESDRSAHAITSDQSKSSAYHSVNHRQVAHKDSGPSIQIPTSVSDPASLSTSQLSAFVGTQQKLNQTEFNINSTDTHGQLISLSKTIEQLAKTQAEMFVWLQTEMSRRKIWEEQCLHEIRQRNLHATSAAQPSSHNGLSILSSNGIIASPSVAGNVNTDGTLGNLSSENLPFHKANGNNRGNSLANEIQQTFMHRAMHVQVNGDSSYPHSATDSHPSSATLGSVTNLQMATPEHDLVTVPALMTHMNDDTSDRQRQIFPNDGLNAPPSIPVSGGDANTLDLLIQQTGTGYQASVLAPDEVSKPIASDEVSKKRKRPRTDSSIDSERAGKRFAVNERGVVYMAGGSTKAMQTPTKIQSIVRKTLYASMGVSGGIEGSEMPIYEQDMNPPDGKEDWRFGNLRFDWNSTMRRCVHNKKMRDIVLKHIISLRNEYTEIADTEFAQARLEQAFDQAFATWKGKYLGKRSGGIRRTFPSKAQTRIETENTVA